MSLRAALWLVPTLPTCFPIYQQPAPNPLCEGLIQAQHNVVKREGVGGRRGRGKRSQRMKIKPFTFSPPTLVMSPWGLFRLSPPWAVPGYGGVQAQPDGRGSWWDVLMVKEEVATCIERPTCAPSQVTSALPPTALM